jgi:hypothetical protein
MVCAEISSKEDIEVSQQVTLEQRILTQLLRLSEEDIAHLESLERLFEISKMKRVSYSIDPYRAGRLRVSIDSGNAFSNIEQLKNYCLDTLKIPEPRLSKDCSLNPNQPGIENQKLNGYNLEMRNFSLYFKVA